MRPCSDKLRKKRERIKALTLNAAINIRKRLAVAERCLNKMKQERKDLMMSLEDQKQISHSWYKELMSVKKTLQEKNEKLLNYELAHDGTYESAVEAEAGRRLKTIFKPLKAAVGVSLQTVLNLVENITLIRSLVDTLVLPPPSPSKYQTRLGTKSSPPLSKGSHTSRRKHVVHPMVEGHVLQPAKISLSRMCLKNKFSDKHKGLSRGSASSTDKHDARPSPSITERIPVICLQNIATSNTETHTLESAQESASSSEVSQDVGTTTPNPILDQTDPLEGPSWLYDGTNRGDTEKFLQKIRRSRDHTVSHFSNYHDDSSDNSSIFDRTPKAKRGIAKYKVPTKKIGRPKGSLNKKAPFKKTSRKQSLSLNKENVPPLTPPSMKLKSVSVVVKDCMKTYPDSGPTAKLGKRLPTKRKLWSSIDENPSKKKIKYRFNFTKAPKTNPSTRPKRETYEKRSPHKSPPLKTAREPPSSPRVLNSPVKPVVPSVNSSTAPGSSGTPRSPSKM